MSTARDFLAAVQQRADGIKYWDDVTGLLPDTERLVAFALAVLDLADELWKFEDENADRAEGKAAAAAAIHHLAEHTLTPKENDS